MSTLPDQIKKIFDVERALSAERLELERFLFNDMLIIPDEQWDWTDALCLHQTENLSIVFAVDIANGPRASIFRKTDVNLPSYVVLFSADHLFWLEW